MRYLMQTTKKKKNTDSNIHKYFIKNKRNPFFNLVIMYIITKTMFKSKKHLF